MDKQFEQQFRIRTCHEVVYLFDGGALPRFQDDVRPGQFASLDVWHTNDGAVSNMRVTQQQTLQLRRRHLVT